MAKYEVVLRGPEDADFKRLWRLLNYTLSNPSEWDGNCPDAELIVCPFTTTDDENE